MSYWSLETDVELNEVDLEHIATLVREGYTSGEIVQ